MQAGTTKRRRVDNSSSTLSKPFKSPLRRQADSLATTANVDEGANQTACPSPSRGRPGDMTQSDEPASPSDSRADLTRRKRNVGLPAGSTDAGGPTASSSRSPVAARLTSLRKQESSLLSRLVSLRRDLDTVSQALRVEQTGQDAELETLVAKWKGVCRDAAEELFAGARDRVNRMGGVSVWKEKVKNAKMRRMEGWDETDEKDKDEDEDEDEDVAAEKRRRRKELEDEVRNGEADQEKKNRDGCESEEEDAETFTMDMMLKSLNVDLDVIGFDKVNQRWID